MERKIDISEIDKWPGSWAGTDEDLEYGRRIMELMKPFIRGLLNSSYSSKTMKEHIDNLWLLGGHIIKHINYHKENRKQDPRFLLTRFIDSFDGPNISDLSEYEQKSFDRTCIFPVPDPNCHLFYLGLAVSTASIFSLAFFVVIFVFHNYIASYEERLLDERFGEEYRKYKRRTGKWVPRIGKGS
jgi:hypothetical protein